MFKLLEKEYKQQMSIIFTMSILMADKKLVEVLERYDIFLAENNPISRFVIEKLDLHTLRIYDKITPSHDIIRFIIDYDKQQLFSLDDFGGHGFGSTKYNYKTDQELLNYVIEIIELIGFVKQSS